MPEVAIAAELLDVGEVVVLGVLVDVVTDLCRGVASVALAQLGDELAGAVASAIHADRVALPGWVTFTPHTDPFQ